MSASRHELANDPATQIEDAVSRLWGALQGAYQSGDAQLNVSDEAIAKMLTAAIKLYHAKTESEDRTFRPLFGEKDEHVSATEVITAATEVLRAMSLGPMELALWWRRRREDAGFVSEEQARPAELSVTSPGGRHGSEGSNK